MNATTVHSSEVVGQLALIETDPIRQRVEHAFAGFLAGYSGGFSRSSVAHAEPTSVTRTPSMPPERCYRNRRCLSIIEQMESLNRSAVEAMPDERVFLAASYLDVAEVEADFEALRRLYVDLGEAPGFDAVTIGRKASGEVRFHREPDRPQGSATDEHVAPSLAAGLAAALFPSVAADIPVGRLEEREILGTVAGVVAIALGRSGLSTLGDQLDSSSAGLIAVGTAEQQDRIQTALTNARAAIAWVASVDVERIERTTDQVHRRASKRRRTTS